ncbi:MFS transporter [Methanoregula sp.]|uniref:MFS transporter n=1 Tax=Methanoregula sp. TaxID=2052170 RepID=UPI002C6E10D4|nr:MFS transporter [Methanoregula sp.]HVP95815.1 MFS transporter [Methanoregula sp.]
MKAYLVVVCLGVFALMALSNAIVPVLPAFANGAAWEGAIYAAYFLGAFLSTLPGGILSDRYGRTPVIRTGLLLTVASGALLFCTTGPVPVIFLRLVEGIGAGLFIAAGMSYVNSQEDHTRLSGYYLAMLNVGLVTGLAVSGWLAVRFLYPALGIGVFTALSLMALVTSLFFREMPTQPLLAGAILQRGSGEDKNDLGEMADLIFTHGRLWYSAIILVGITGVVSSLYPGFSGMTADLLGYWIAAMSVATIITVLAVSRFPIPPRAAIRWSAALMIGGVILAYVSPLGFIVLGALAGVVMVAQMSVLAGERDRQGLVMGLFSTSSYLGMTILPFIAGIIAAAAGYYLAFLFTAILGGTVALTICSLSRCPPHPVR